MKEKAKSNYKVLQKCKSTQIKKGQRLYLQLHNKNKNLTPQEIQIVDLIKQGKNTKEIAGMLNASPNTIATHRNNIREKLNLRNAKVNLRSYLQSLS
jgi:DNA-binding CsgD family transcriptional regulator